MGEPLALMLAAAFGYLLGAVPFGVVITRTLGLGDLRRIGSGNIGATNVLRTGNKGLAALTLLLDALKGTLANLALTPALSVVTEILEPLRRREERADYPEGARRVLEEMEKLRALIRG